jgi:chaperonin cofactor prefoldin
MVVRKVGPSVIEKPKRKRVNNEKELQNRLENLRIKLSYSKSQEKFLEN